MGAFGHRVRGPQARGRYVRVQRMSPSRVTRCNHISCRRCTQRVAPRGIAPVVLEEDMRRKREGRHVVKGLVSIASSRCIQPSSKYLHAQTEKNAMLPLHMIRARDVPWRRQKPAHQSFSAIRSGVSSSFTPSRSAARTRFISSRRSIHSEARRMISSASSWSY